MDNPNSENEAESRLLTWSLLGEDEGTAEGMAGHWALVNSPVGNSPDSGLWAETENPNLIALYDIEGKNRIGSLNPYFASQATKGRIWLELYGKYFFFHEVDS